MASTELVAFTRNNRSSVAQSMIPRNQSAERSEFNPQPIQ